MIKTFMIYKIIDTCLELIDSSIRESMRIHKRRDSRFDIIRRLIEHTFLWQSVIYKNQSGEIDIDDVIYPRQIQIDRKPIKIRI